MVIHDCAAVAALRAAYVKSLPRSTMTKTEASPPRSTWTLSLPPPLPATLLTMMLPTLKTMPTIPKKKKTPEAPIPDDQKLTMKTPEVPIPDDAATETETKTETKTENETETETENTQMKMKHVATEADDETKKKKKPPEVTKPMKPMKQDDNEDHEDMEKKKKKTEEAPSLKDPDNDIGVSPIDHPGYPEDGINFHPPPPSPIALHLQGPFPDG
jgi:hypothetical protein